MTTTLDQWQDLTGDIEDPIDEMAEDTDETEEDYSVVTKHTLATHPMVKICFWGGGILLVMLIFLGIFLGVNASSNTAKRKQQQQQASVPPGQPNTGLSESDRELVDEILDNDTFGRQRNRQKVLNGRRPQGQQPRVQAKAKTQESMTAQRTVTAPRIIYRDRPVSQRTSVPTQQAPRQFTVQRPVAVAPQPEEDDPNAGYFTAPFTASSKPPVSSQRKLLKLTKSEGFKDAKKPVQLFNPPTQIASASKSIPQPKPQQLGNLSGNLQSPYLNQIVATAKQAVIPVDTAIDAQVVSRVSWIPENPGLAKGKVLRLKLQEDLKDGAGDVIANRGTIALGMVNEATEQGLISVNLTKIGSKFVQSGAVEIHQDGDPTMIAKLEKKGGSNGFLKTALDIGIGGVQTLTSNLNNPTSQTSFTNGNQTFLSTNNNNRNSTAAFVEGATNRIGERLRQSVEGPTQTQIGVFRFGGKVQLYFVREVRL